MANGKTIIIEVTPDIANKPQACLSERDPKAAGRDKIRWVKAKNAPDFDFIALAPDTAPLQNPFKSIDIKKNRIKCDFDANDVNVKYEYTIVIEFEGVPYDSDDEQGPTLGRAVIRN